MPGDAGEVRTGRADGTGALVDGRAAGDPLVDVDLGVGPPG